MTCAAVQALYFAEKPLAHFSMGGWFYGMTTGLGLKNVFLRRDQFRRADDERFCLTLASDLVSTKIRNQRTLLQRNHVEPPAIALDRLKRLANPVNALLSFAYSLLTRDLTIVCHAVGFDPFVGFYHQPRFGRAALAH